jgi:hypothetical protein
MNWLVKCCVAIQYSDKSVVACRCLVFALPFGSTYDMGTKDGICG